MIAVIRNAILFWIVKNNNRIGRVDKFERLTLSFGDNVWLSLWVIASLHVTNKINYHFAFF
jgi:hypothetical protein